MLIGLLMILIPAAVFLFTLPLSKRLKPGLRKVYVVLGGIVVLLGSAVSVYFAAFTGDQGGIAAFYFQILVIVVYAALTLSLIIINWIIPGREVNNVGD